MKVVVRADASVAIGSGHIMRCLALAESIKAAGGDVKFLCREVPGHCADYVEKKGFEVYRREGLLKSTEEDAEWALSVLSNIKAVDWIVVDHYALDRNWERRVRNVTTKILVVDDLANRPHDCDILVDQNLYDEPARRYSGLVHEACRVLIGPRYAMLRRPFREAKAQRKPPEGVVKRLFVSFGGTDPTGETLKVLEAIRSLALPGIAVDVVIGAANLQRDAIARACSEVPRCVLHVQTEEVAGLMAGADLGIGAGGIASWERCATGLPALVWATAENQRGNVGALARYGAAVHADEVSVTTAEGIARYLFALVNSRELLRNMSRNAAALCDGRGTERVIAAMEPESVSVRIARDEDCAVMFAWRNDPDVRRASFNDAPVSWSSHQKWFNESLGRKDRIILVGEVNGEPVGIVRFDDIDGGTAEVSIYVDPSKTGRGLGATLLKAGENWLLNKTTVRRITARVRSENAKSQHFFSVNGYRSVYGAFMKSFQR